METILIVEDDRSVRNALKRLFEYEGYKVEVSGDGQSALERFNVLPPTAIILDLGLPVVPGKDVCREIRRQSRSVPIIVVSARADDADKVSLLDLGADDYVTKPFSPRELLARVRAAIRHCPREESTGSNNHILRLRQKLEPEPDNPRHIVTVRGMGYQFVP